jgi:hypothetical protein
MEKGNGYSAGPFFCRQHQDYAMTPGCRFSAMNLVDSQHRREHESCDCQWQVNGLVKSENVAGGGLVGLDLDLFGQPS